MLTDNDIQLLSSWYNQYKETDDRDFDIFFQSDEERSQIINTLNKLKELDFINNFSPASGMVRFRLSMSAISFAENGYKDTISQPTIVGDQNIIVTGDNNSVTQTIEKISL